MDMHSAIRESCNVFFYNVGIEVGAEDLARVARKFGLGKVTGIDLLNEKEGLVPNDAWKQSVLREPWYKGETPPLSIGQGYLNVTPIQVVHMINILVNQGLSVPPKLHARPAQPRKFLDPPQVRRPRTSHDFENPFPLDLPLPYFPGFQD